MSDAVIEPSAMHVHRGTRAVQRMVEHAPSTGGLALWARHRDLPTDADVDVDAVDAVDAGHPPAATDGRTIFYRAAFERLPVALQAGWVAHLVLHIALRHAQRFMELRQRSGDADLQLFNICADAIVNSALGHLAWLELPASAVRLEQLLGSVLGQKESAEAALLAWDVERLYRAIDDREPPASGGREPARGASAAGEQQASANATRRADGPRAAMARALGAALATDLAPGKETLGAPQDEADEARQWAERVLRGHVGDGAHSMLRALIADLPRPRTPWEQVLRTQLARALAQRPGLSWSRPSRSYIANQGRTGQRRMPWEPGTTASRAVPRLALVVDVSGSIDEALMERFAREIEALSRRLEAPLVLVVGDDRVRSVEHFEPGRSALRDLVFQGGGDTDFTPLLEEAQRHSPDIIVVLTDLEGPARYRPSCPVLWAVPQSHDVSQPGAVAPFGRVLPLH